MPVQWLDRLIFYYFHWKACLMPTTLDELLRRLMKNSLFRDREKLRPDYVPDTLPHREGHITQLAQILLPPIIRGARPSNVFIYGYTGTGKTAVTRYVLNWIASRFGDGGGTPRKVMTAMVNCSNNDTNYRVLRALNVSLGVRVPFTGLSVAELYERFKRKLDSGDTIMIVALDEIDSLVKKSGDELLYKLTRINSELTKARLSLIGITNDLNFRDYLDARVRSSLGEEELVFQPYNADELRDILEHRAKLAFYPGVIEDGVIPLCAHLAAREHGDARRALDLLRVAGEIAEREGAEKITIEHVKRAVLEIERDKAVELIRTLPFHSKAVLMAIYLLRDRPGGATTGEIYEVYTKLVRGIGLDPVTQRRVSDIISELDVVGLVQARLLSRGRYGRTKYVSLRVGERALTEGLRGDELLRGYLDRRGALGFRV